LVESVQNKSDEVRFTHVVTRSPDRVSPVVDRLDLALLPDLASSLVTLMATTPDFRLKIFGTTGSAELRDPETMVLTSADGDRETRSFAPVDMVQAELEAYADAIAGQAIYPVPIDEVLWGIAAFEGVSRSITEGRTVTAPPEIVA
jgi:predicted dehydrogenase